MSQTSLELDARSMRQLHPNQTETSVAVIPDPAEVAEVVDELPPSSITEVSSDPYTGVAALPFNERAQIALAKYQTVPDSWLDIKPNGQIYLSHMKLRGIFNEAFLFGGWGLVPVGAYQMEEDGNKVTVYREHRLYVAGRFVGQALGAGEYYKSNAEQNYGDACEAAQSYALNRLGKPFGIASQCWDKAYVAYWKDHFAEQYQNTRSGKKEWRKKAIKESTAGRTEPDGPVERAEPIAGALAVESDPDKVLTAVMIPVSFGKILKWGGFVVDAEGKTWTFPTKLLPVAEKAMINGQTLAVSYRQKYNEEKKKTFWNVTEAKPL